MLRVPLDPGFDGFRLACLRAPTGADELAAEVGGVALLDRLLVAESADYVPPGAASRLPVADRDRLLAELHRHLFGDAIEADATCAACDKPFELRFSLRSLSAGCAARLREGVDGPDALGRFRLGKTLFRLPASADVAAAAAGPEDRRRQALLAACVVEGDADGQEDSIEEAMAALGPALDVDVETLCPHCAGASTARLEIGSYLLKCLANERRFLLREVHRLARAYRWSCSEILALPRNVRQELVRLIDSEAEPARRSLSLVR
jgi:hypothetical protein